MQTYSVILTLLATLAFNYAIAQEFPSSGRLKFKHGPVCMCDKGLSEKDIREAEAKRAMSGMSNPNDGFYQNESSQKAERRSDEEK